MKLLRFLCLAFVVTLIIIAGASSAPAATRRLSLVIGVNNGGSSRSTLRYATSDAVAMSQVLGELGGLDASDQILLRDPTLPEFTRSLEAFADRARSARTSGDRVEALIYFSGHSNETGLLFGEEVFGYQALRRAFGALEADVRVAIVDSCSSGVLTRSKGGRKRAPLGLDASATVSGSAILTSASATEAAQESDSIGASFFTHYLVSGLRGAADVTGDGRITLTEAYQFAYQETLRRTERTQVGAQHANYEFRLAGSGELVLTDVRNTEAVLNLDKKLDGRLFVRDGAGRLVVEVNKLPDRAVSLGLESGTYYVTLSQPARLLGGEVTVGSGAPKTLRESDLSKLSRERVAMRGDSGELQEVEVEFGLEQGGYVEQRFCLSFIPGIGSCPNLARGETRVTRFQLSLLLGWSDIIDGWDVSLVSSLVSGRVEGNQVAGMLGISNGRLDGVQLAGFYAMTTGDADAVQLGGLLAVGLEEFNGTQIGGIGSYIGGSSYSAQLAGVAAIAADDKKGFQGAGVLAIASQEVDGAQVAGVTAINGGGIHGAQVSGVLNISGGAVSGAQVAGAAAISAGGVDGAQVSGAVNISGGPVLGAQVASGLNISGDALTGTQVGVVNVAWGPVSGSQIGLINVAERYDEGVPIGLLNFVKDGQLHLELWASDVFMSNIGARFGSDAVYTLVAVGTQPELGGNRARSGFSLGAGTNFDITDSTWGAIDAVVTALAFDDEGDQGVPVDLFEADRPELYQLRARVGFELSGFGSLYGGASLNVFVGDDGRERPGLAFVSGATFGDETLVRIWPGFFAGVQF